MNYYTFTVAFICASTSRIWVSSVNSPSSENPWKTPTTSTVMDVLKMFSTLYIYQTVCSQQPYGSGNLYCQEFIKENNDYFMLKQVMETKINEAQCILVKLLALERKAIACRGMRYLLAINIYGTFVNFASSESTKKSNVSEKDIFDEMFPTKFDHGDKKKIKELRTFVNGKSNDTFLNVRDTLYDTIGRTQETQLHSFLHKIKCIVQAIQPFITELNDFHDFDKIKKIINSIEVDTSTSCRWYFSFIFREINDVYTKECFPNVDATAFLGADNVEKIIGKNYSASKLAEKIDWLFEEVQRDMAMLYIKCFYINNKGQFVQDVSMMYFHAFNKYYDSRIWRLIGDEIVMDKSNSSGTVQTSLNNVAPKVERQITRILEYVNLSVHNSIRCRIVVYMNVMMKLGYLIVRVLTENVSEVQRLAATLSEQQERIGEFVERVAKYGTHHVAATVTLGEVLNVFDEMHNHMGDIGIDGHVSDVGLSSTIDVLNRNATVEKEFKSVFVIYFMFTWYLVGETIENYQWMTNRFDLGFAPMLQDLKRTTVDLENQTVEHILKWHDWALQTYKDNCNSDIHTNISDDEQLTLSSIISKMEVLYEDFQRDIYEICKYFHV